jgi:PAS domain-containing protein
MTVVLHPSQDLGAPGHAPQVGAERDSTGPSARVILDTLAAPVAVLDQVGTIVATNRVWDEFGQANQSREASHIGVNYLDVCARATGGDAPCAKAAAPGLRSVLAGERAFTLEYPCHSPDRPRWFQLRATRLEDNGAVDAVVAHPAAVTR